MSLRSLPSVHLAGRAKLRNGSLGSDGIKTIDWPTWLRLVERKRRRLGRPRSTATWPQSTTPTSAGSSGRRSQIRRGRRLPSAFLQLGTLGSFRLEGIDVTESIVIAATRWGRERARFRSRLAQRIRGHIAILHHIERALGCGELLKTAAVVRWYTQVSSGLSITSLDEPTMARLDELVRRINSPHLRLQPAVQEIAHLHADALADPLVPGFNGILARLLLHYHLGRCRLPPVVFDSETDAAVLGSETKLLARLLALIDQSYDLLLCDDAATVH